MAITASIKGRVTAHQGALQHRKSHPSSSGITLLVASATETTDVMVKGKALKIQLNAMIKV